MRWYQAWISVLHIWESQSHIHYGSDDTQGGIMPGNWHYIWKHNHIHIRGQMRHGVVSGWAIGVTYGNTVAYALGVR
jgi:hypothetical protein